MDRKYLRNLFLLDGFGALLSAFLLGIVLVKLESYFGIPKTTLYVLAALPCLFAMYDFLCYFKLEKNLEKFLKPIAIANLMYCCLSIGLTLFHFKRVTYIGWIYIIGEVIIVVSIALIELRAANYDKTRGPFIN